MPVRKTIYSISWDSRFR